MSNKKNVDYNPLSIDEDFYVVTLSSLHHDCWLSEINKESEE